MNKSENLELASIRSRAFAFVIDDFLVTLIVILIYWDKIAIAGDDVMSALIIMNDFILQVLFLKFLYQSFFVWYYGATVGKIVTKIKVIDFYNFGKVSITSAMLRSIFRIVSEMFFYIGFIFAFFNDGRQTFHDKLGRTLVVNA
ncbi:RDD family protein [Halarcobacter ebronensis]|uniref:RDD family protein n=1 Tax=Halarcobacter ebronensis TaxID=1462615 RepID=A0A4Q0YHT1_9BACT|nr:RDD family protein [Halarcobacter ebronensis]QKF82070.1 RDD family membrane protein [Halarcobacter ebronensis]RXJ70212.1 RDD family protein [Halarcobacter ebronensis]RXK04098.1 RDD family protein [Halarcobacter ebronensis]